MKRIVVSILFSALLLSPLAGWAANSGDNWRNLSPQEKEKVRRNYQRWQHLPPEDKEHLREEWDRYVTDADESFAEIVEEFAGRDLGT